MNVKCCSECRFAAEVEVEQQGRVGVVKVRQRECRRLPPVPVPIPVQGGAVVVTQFPRALAPCGEGQPTMRYWRSLHASPGSRCAICGSEEPHTREEADACVQKENTAPAAGAEPPPRT